MKIVNNESAYRYWGRWKNQTTMRLLKKKLWASVKSSVRCVCQNLCIEFLFFDYSDLWGNKEWYNILLSKLAYIILRSINHDGSMSKNCL